MPDDSDDTTDTLEPISYLSRSENRIQVLEALTETIPAPGLYTSGYEPRELRDVTGASEATVSRILTEFEERGWAERDVGGEYTATPLAQSITLEFAPLLESMEAIDNLGDAVALLPLDELSISLRHFGDATIRQPTPHDPNDFGMYLNDHLQDASVFRWITYVVPPTEMGRVMEPPLAAGETTISGINSKSVYEFYRNTQERGPRYTLESDGTWEDLGMEWYCYDGHLPCNLFIFDETVIIENSQVGRLEPGTAIETQDDTVRSWAQDTFERYREAAELVEIGREFP